MSKSQLARYDEYERTKLQKIYQTLLKEEKHAGLTEIMRSVLAEIDKQLKRHKLVDKDGQELSLPQQQQRQFFSSRMSNSHRDSILSAKEAVPCKETSSKSQSPTNEKSLAPKLLNELKFVDDVVSNHSSDSGLSNRRLRKAKLAQHNKEFLFDWLVRADFCGEDFSLAKVAQHPFHLSQDEEQVLTVKEIVKVLKVFAYKLGICDKKIDLSQKEVQD